MKDGYASMIEWDATWRGHHLPVWLRKAIRLSAIRDGKWRPATSWGHTTAESLLPWDVFDHWGSVKRGIRHVVIAQPYWNQDEKAKKFADEVGCNLKISNPGPWHENTWLYEFSQKL
jgi:hypothetical protein